MKQKPDEALDQWVRQSLSRLPDTPPPGSSFDSERLWQQMRPELQVEQPRRRARWIGWAAAAVVAGLVTLWGSMHRPDTRPVSATTVKNEQATTHSTIPLKADEQLVKSVSESEKEERNVPKIASKRVKAETVTPRQQVDGHSEVTVAVDFPESESDASRERGIRTPSTLESTLLGLDTKTPVAQHIPKQTKAKPRFKVVHENELKAEEEARPKLYQTGNFVRLGTGQLHETEQPERQPALVIPLTNKPNQ
ncbi:hypothetical protein GCM10028806_14260 [Spirosoma terrae]|uniref:Uncharacterized protein n=1 Tax=Spirosoma terrae TaxID=1968276 RepID=A0A6L9L9M1_9BACT|nr:hypothetical protein [Spirosoma terrae]NDU95078.1 hypothetical protein [Spirosoma terrae]